MSDYSMLLARIAELEAENATLKAAPAPAPLPAPMPAPEPMPHPAALPAPHLSEQEVEAIEEQIEKLKEMVGQDAQA